MSTPTLNEVLSIRADTGDVIGPFLLGYQDIADVYNNTDGDYNQTVYTCLRRMRSRLTTLRGCEHNAAERIKAIDAMLPAWKEEAGAYGTISTGRLNLGLDAGEEDEWGGYV